LGRHWRVRVASDASRRCAHHRRRLAIRHGRWSALVVIQGAVMFFRNLLMYRLSPDYRLDVEALPKALAPGAGAPTRTELTRISGPAVGAPPRCEPPHPFAPGAGAPARTELTRISGPAVGAPPRCEPPHPFAPGPGGLRPASAHSKVHADPLPVDL